MSIIMKKRKENKTKQKKKQNVKNIDIIFDARQLFNTSHTTKFDPRYLRTYVTHSTHVI